MWDAIVIGAGISGLTAAAALSRMGEKVLLLEQHWQAGGLTQTFKREHWRFATGVHYLTGLADSDGPAGQFRRLLDWLSSEPMHFAAMDNPYDIVCSGDFSFGIEHPQERYRAALHRRFPMHRDAIDAWFKQADQATSLAHLAVMERGLPGWMTIGLRWWKGREIGRLAERTVADALSGITDPNLRMVLGARGANYGAAAKDAPVLEHALVTQAYNAGAYFPVGGPGEFARCLVPTIKAQGGSVVLGADVTAIHLDREQVAAVSYRRGRQEHRAESTRVVSTMGVVNTLARLPEGAAPEWREAICDLAPGPGYVALYLGFSGDIAAAGASRANVWLYEDPSDIDRLWDRPLEEDSPGLFISFPSLKDPEHDGEHTGEILAMCSSEAFAPYFGADPVARSEDYEAFKAKVEARLLAQFRRHFPQLAEMIAFHETSTPLSQHRFVRTPMGAMYGLEMSSERLTSEGLSVRTPVRGLLLAGQDVTGSGVQPSCISGMLAAAAIRPGVLRHMNG